MRSKNDKEKSYQSSLSLTQNEPGDEKRKITQSQTAVAEK